MKINRLDAHDRLQHFVKQDFDIGKICQNIIDQRPFGEHTFYIFAHARTVGLDEKLEMYNSDLNKFLTNPSYTRRYETLDQVPEKKIIWQPRLTKPKSQPNSMLFKACPGSDNIKVLWMIPPEEMWDQYIKGNMNENKLVSDSIHDFKQNRSKLDAKEPDDLTDAQIDAIYHEISKTCKSKKLFKLEI